MAELLEMLVGIVEVIVDVVETRKSVKSDSCDTSRYPRPVHPDWERNHPAIFR